MATLKQRLHRKNSSGTYDTVHLESSSDLILRPSGRTVEQDLADYLPQVQNNDNVPESLAKLIIGNSKAWIYGKEIQFISGSSSYLIQYGTTESSQVTFTTPYSTIPIVLVQPYYRDNVGGEVVIQRAYSISRNGFSSVSWEWSGGNWVSSYRRVYYWIAVGN